MLVIFPVYYNTAAKKFPDKPKMMLLIVIPSKGKLLGVLVQNENIFAYTVMDAIMQNISFKWLLYLPCHR